MPISKRDGTQARRRAGAPVEEVKPAAVEGQPAGIDRATGAGRDHRKARGSPMEETVVHRPPAVRRKVERSRSDVDTLLGRRIGQYRVESVLGRGSMACVFKARHLGLSRHCALKVMDPGLFVEQPQLREQFWAEARAAANVVHPHVVTIHNLGSVDGFHFIEMEFVPGGITLRESLVREGPLEPRRAVKLAREVVLALGAAHDAGLVHRDIKPANVLLTPDGRARSWLISAWCDGLMISPREAAPLAGTPTFMAPELFRERPRARSPTSMQRVYCCSIRSAGAYHSRRKTSAS